MRCSRQAIFLGPVVCACRCGIPRGWDRADECLLCTFEFGHCIVYFAVPSWAYTQHPSIKRQQQSEPGADRMRLHPTIHPTEEEQWTVLGVW